jgi:hypothetical protein
MHVTLNRWAGALPLMKLWCSSGDGRAANDERKATMGRGVDGDILLYGELTGVLVRSQDKTPSGRVLQSLHESGWRRHSVLCNTLNGTAEYAAMQHASDVLNTIMEASDKPGETTCSTILNTCVRAKDSDVINHAMSLAGDQRFKAEVTAARTSPRLCAHDGNFQGVRYSALIAGRAHAHVGETWILL